MYSEYIIERKNGSLEDYYSSENTIYFRKVENGKFLGKTAIIENVSGDFSVSVLNENTIVIFCRKTTGEIIAAINSGGSINIKHILKQYSGEKIRAYICALNTQTTIIYNAAAENRNILICQKLSESGKWDIGERIDETLPGGIFDVKSKNGSVTAYYERCDGVFGCRLIEAESISPFHELNKMSKYICDISYIQIDSTFHILYAIKSMISGHLYYKRKNSDGSEKITVLCEGLIRKCCIYKIKNTLYFVWAAGDKVYMRKSGDNGNNFSKPEIIKEHFLRKASISVYSEEFTANEVFVNEQGIIHCETVFLSKNSETPNFSNVEKNHLNAENIKIKNQLEMLIRSNAEKDRQIAALSSTISEKKKEYIENEVKLIKDIQKLKKENEELRKIIED